MSRNGNGNRDSDALGHVIKLMCIAHHGTLIGLIMQEIVDGTKLSMLLDLGTDQDSLAAF